jgi:hypothetical protein
MVPAAPAFVAAVEPGVVLQSTARSRLREDKWDGHLQGIRRHTTARDGMVELAIDRAGEIFSQGTVQDSADAALK